ncbi:S41 family peptidase [Ornithinibacillus halophilus]|uniref:Carboxyl-terminal processing protease n=1 Tax=Ornithinibacillus halophilus TaxID=930117 RepID=A0A1M5FBF9_9BACI|nr:S41 family peptidase [Ornithinibacillus halophilus]SHF88895.1 carboxyl-terminal processing protease [Ornithinibacillus halophilus]
MKLKMPQIVLILIGALVLGFVGAYAGVQLGDSEEQENSNENTEEIANQDENHTEDVTENEQVDEIPDYMTKVVQAFHLIKQNYLEDVEDQQLIEGAIQGMLTTLGDPYSSYMDVEVMEQFNEQIESSFEGIGAEVSMMNGAVTIVAPIKDSPAEKEGLRPNDQVLEVDGESLEGLDLNEAVAKIRGEKGSEVVLTILRPGSSEPFEVTIVRDTIPLETIYAEMKSENGKNTGIIEITNFSETTSTDFNTELERLESEGMDGLVIDVRGNPGGLLSAVEEILMNFVPSDVPYVQIEDPNGNRSPYFSKLEEKKDYPITVLINEGSASASEILAVAMKEIGYDVVGMTTFGKGTVQQAVPLGDGSSIKLTYYKWLSPEGNWIHETGVEPTVEVDQPEYFYTNPINLEDETLTLDQSDSKIANIQKMLDGIGYNPGRLDGYFNQETMDAVKAFQQDHDISVTGEIDKQTVGLIEATLIERIRSGEDDQQLERALEVLYE